MREKIIISILLVLTLSNGICQVSSYRSWDGFEKGISSKSHFRALNIFANIIFDVDSTMDPVK